jgi:hypothetical protein
MREVASVAPALGDRVIIQRLAADDGFRVGEAPFQEARHVGEVMLPVGIDLQGVTETGPPRRAHAGHYRRSLAGVLREAQQAKQRLFGSEHGEHGLCRVVAAVVDDEDGQGMRQQALDGAADALLVVIDGDQDAGFETHVSTSRTIRPLACLRCGVR